MKHTRTCIHVHANAIAILSTLANHHTWLLPTPPPPPPKKQWCTMLSVLATSETWLVLSVLPAVSTWAQVRSLFLILISRPNASNKLHACMCVLHVTTHTYMYMSKWLTANKEVEGTSPLTCHHGNLAYNVQCTCRLGQKGTVVLYRRTEGVECNGRWC